MRLSAGTRLGPYEILTPLGRGGMGEVYCARDSRLGRDVAVKILAQHLANDSGARTRFEREAMAVAALSHPNIVVIFDLGEERGVRFAVMELLHGETLRERIQRSSCSPGEAAAVGAAIAEGLGAAHAKGVIHRDLKPENVFLTVDGQVKVLDFGLARVASPVPGGPGSLALTATETMPGTILGTFAYMSPEQVRGDTSDAPSDIFSLGCVLYETATGRPAFSRPSAAENDGRHSQRHSTANHGVPRLGPHRFAMSGKGGRQTAVRIRRRVGPAPPSRTSCTTQEISRRRFDRGSPIRQRGEPPGH